MAHKQSKKVLKVEYEDLQDPENSLRCNGLAFYQRGDSTAVGLCTKPHPHQERRKVITFDDGTQESRIVGPGWNEKFKTDKDLQRHGGEPESIEQWARDNGLESRPGESIKDHAARCLAYMAALAPRGHGSHGAVKTLARIAGVDLSDPGPDIREVAVRHDDQPGDTCRCGRELIAVDWSMHGVSNPAPVCPGCRDLRKHCSCEESIPF